MRSVRRSWCLFSKRWASTLRRTFISCLALDSQVPTSRTLYLNVLGTRKSPLCYCSTEPQSDLWFAHTWSYIRAMAVTVRGLNQNQDVWLQIICYLTSVAPFLIHRELHDNLTDNQASFFPPHLRFSFLFLHQGIAIYFPFGQFAKLHQN